VPDHPVVLALLEEVGEPLLSSTLLLPGDELPLTDVDEIRERLEKQLDAIIDAGHCGGGLTTVINLTGESPELVRTGLGSLAPFGLG
jgi:tRNA A37 threonylcarbamoyladenosine synthetase subunit TsaC/SUA5/YrdC